jgi:imidazolonepropionase-like amidohydrolase
MAPPDKTQRVREMQLQNLRLLKNAGVRFGIGPDVYGKTPLIEAMYLHQLGVFSNLELLKIWCENTPEDIFPNRKIGHLQEGYEASFIVLPTNPIESFNAVNSIKLRFKQGHPLT